MNKKQHRILPALLLAFLGAAATPRAAPAEERHDTAPPVREAAEQAVPPAAKTPPPVRRPAASFTPSEKVGADSAVAFPVDI